MIEPLHNLLQIYNDKHKVLLNYLPNKTIKKLNNYQYVTDNESLFLNDRLIFVQKNTGKIYQQGIIIKITTNKITIKTRNSNISLPKENYYIFINPRKNKLQKNNRKFYQELLKSLQ
tara:strand:- start:274 stop:624 length:351 start_codon:yes stop_codon:yes gene_type:complete